MKQTSNIKKYDLVVHHGGSGIMNYCLWNGVPAVVYPRDYDQFDNAARLEHAGLAHRLRRLGELQSMVATSISSSGLRSRCAAFAASHQASIPNHRLQAIVSDWLNQSR